MKPPYRPRRDFESLRKRRLRAGKMFDEGVSQAEVGRKLRTTSTSVSRWYQQWKESGPAALQGARRAGRKPRLDARQLKQIERALREGPEAHGFVSGLWTVPRMTEVIRRVSGVTYHPGHVWKLLPLLGWSLQKPSRQALQRDEKQVQHWVSKTWKGLKKSPKE